MSVLAHAVALAVWVQVNHQASGAISISRKHGGMTVQLLKAPQAHPLVKPAPAAPTAALATAARATSVRKADQPKAIASQDALPQLVRPPSGVPMATVDATPRPGTHADKPNPAATSAPSNNEASSPTLQAAPIAAQPPASATAAAAASTGASQAEAAAAPPPASPTPPAANPGARFASLFAPLVSQPMGHGKWHSNTPSFRPPQEVQAAMQREQAIAGLRQAVQRQSEHWQALLGARALAGRCDIRLSLERQGMQLRCTSDEDFARLAGSLQGVLNIHPDLAPQASDSCLLAQGHDLAWVACESQSAPASGLAAGADRP